MPETVTTDYVNEIRLTSGNYATLLENFVSTNYSLILDKIREWEEDSINHSCSISLYSWENGIRIHVWTKEIR